jgi:GTPase KRas protein
LVANKKDLITERQVSTEEGRQLAERYKVPFLETSAKTSENVAEAFLQLIREVIKFRLKNPQKKDKEKGKRCIFL